MINKIIKKFTLSRNRTILETWKEWKKGNENFFIAEYICQALNGVDTKLRNVDTDGLVKIKNYIDELEIKNNTKIRYYAQIKAFFGLYSRYTKIDTITWRKIFSVHKEACTYAYLIPEDIVKISEVRTITDYEKCCKDIFLIGCLTGARVSDYSQFTPENIHNGVLSYVSQKTGMFASVPVCRLLQRIFDRADYKLERPAEFTISYTIRRLARRAGITRMTTVYNGCERITKPLCELISSHTARRSFCRNLREYNTPLETIRDMAGHSGVTMTERYVGRNLNFQRGKTTKDMFDMFV